MVPATLVALASVVGAAACAGGERRAGASDAGLASGTPEATTQPGAPSADASDSGRGTTRVVFLGTSLTAGLGLDPDSAYPALVERKARAAGVPIVVTNAGLSGETSAGALRRVDWVLRAPADVVVIETGANDGLRGQSTDSLAANLRAIVARVHADQPRARVALVQMEAPRNMGGDYARRFHAVFPTVARETGATLFPFLLDGVAGVASLNQADGVHPTEAGARRVADNVWKALAPMLAAASDATGDATVRAAASAVAPTGR